MKKCLLVLFITFLGVNLSAQRVSSCNELNLRPIEPGTGNDLLAIYLDGDGSGVGGHGCWVHHHPNGTDYVVTPHSWGRDPAPGKKGLIEDAMQAITDSRTRYAELGDLSTNLYYILDDINRRTVGDDGSITTLSGEAFWLIGEACWMQSGAPTLRSGEGLAADRGDRKQIFAHEVGHCFVMKNVPDIGRYYEYNGWFDESVSEYLSSLVYPTNDLEHESSVLYDMDGMEYRQDYNAYVLWYYIAKEKGISQVVPLMNRLATFGTMTDRLKFLRRNGYDKLFHEFLFDFYKNEVYDSGGTGAIPRESSITLRQAGEDLITDPSPPVGLLSIPSARLSLYELYIPADYDLIIEPPVNSSETAFFSLLSEGKNIRIWDAPEKIEGNCGSHTVVNILSSHLQDNPVTGSKIIYRLEEREGCCESGFTITENPTENELNGKFNFDYYIESYVNFKSDGVAESLPLNYFVNSKDGSMLIKESWFMDNFGKTESGGYKVDAVIWLPNGQVVGYVYDKAYKKHRAITLALNQTSSDVLGVRAIKIDDFLREAPGSGISPASLPPGSEWSGSSTGYAFYQADMSDPTILNLVSGYISNDEAFATSPLPSFGFMVGYVRDQNRRNKKLVYTRYDSPDGMMIEAHLLALEKKCASFNGEKYKKMILGGGNVDTIATMNEDEREDMVASQQNYNERIMALFKEMEDCGSSDACIAEKSRQIRALTKEKHDAMYDLMSDPSGSGSAGSDLLTEQRAIRDEAFALKEVMEAKKLECKRLASFGSLMAAERCKTDYEVMEDEMDKLECKMLKLQGLEDTMEGCE